MLVDRLSNKKVKRFVSPSVEDVREYCRERGNSVDPEEFVDFYTAKGWVVGKSPMKDWKAAVRQWERNSFGSKKQPETSTGGPRPLTDEEIEKL